MTAPLLCLQSCFHVCLCVRNPIFLEAKEKRGGGEEERGGVKKRGEG